ncbi:2-dehydropantoate 2-reductase [Prosthecomicrobium hirschii]|uniref:ketopantoate reductase family protein n=1 Tax=Prosthecodimorpha hirschii TaxID=665126 RepID=UPI00112767C2|nr:2-dehydropantoate 2-reductase [Prosthecomicrobium hirschii]TPQ48803.1 2-dehydropantoate 2-reductase [Prosthecomicrobium hirschii]
MRIAIMGTGGVGGFFGAKLAASGADVTFIARGAHGAAIAERGLTIDSPAHPVAGLAVRVTDDPAKVGPVDVVMVAVKLWDTAAAAEQLRPMVGPETVVISFQNGIEAGSLLRAALGAEHVAGGVAHISATIAAPGVIRQVGSLARIIFGAFGGGTDPRLVAFSEACRAAGIEHTLSPDIDRAIWEKFVFLSAFSAITALTRKPIGDIRADADLRAFLRDAASETADVARARGVAIVPEQADKVLAAADNLPAATRASMAHDLERGARLELPWLSGTVVRLGAELGVPTPVHRAVWCALKLHAGGR